MKLLVTIALILCSCLAQAQTKTYESFGNYKVIYSVFNSSFIKPDIAQAYNLTRAKNQVLINIAVIKNDVLGGIPIQISGTATNLMQQARQLDFLTINEKNAVYYLAPLRITNEEVMNFSIEVQPSPDGPTHTLEFSKTLYVD